jgi:hypothetical protein
MELVRKGPGTQRARDFSRARDFRIERVMEYLTGPPQWLVIFTVGKTRMQVKADETHRTIVWDTLVVLGSAIR